MTQLCLRYVHEMVTVLFAVRSGICERYRSHAAAIENTTSNDGDKLGKLNSIQLSRSVAVIVCDTHGACLRTLWEHNLRRNVGMPALYVNQALVLLKTFSVSKFLKCAGMFSENFAIRVPLAPNIQHVEKFGAQVNIFFKCAHVQSTEGTGAKFSENDTALGGTCLRHLS